MPRQIAQSIKNVERKLMRSFGKDISTPRGRLAAKLHFQLLDHAFLRTIWTNFFPVAPGVWRSNQPSQGRIRRHYRNGIHTILNLRGTDVLSFYLFEKEICDELGINLIDIKIYARQLVPREKYLELLDIFETIDRPFLLHCKSGADRAGLASALWLMHMEGVPVATAKKQLGLKYVHVKWSKTGILDHMLDCYEADTAETPMPIRQWFEERYDEEAITASFNGKKGASPQ